LILVDDSLSARGQKILSNAAYPSAAKTVNHPRRGVFDTKMKAKSITATRNPYNDQSFSCAYKTSEFPSASDLLAEVPRQEDGVENVHTVIAVDVNVPVPSWTTGHGREGI